MKVYGELKKNDLPGSQTGGVQSIVGRDAKTLDREGVTKAAVETVAENASDGVIAPLFYTALGGPVLGFLYKAVNTMDSMVGYKNEKYLYSAVRPPGWTIWPISYRPGCQPFL